MKVWPFGVVLRWVASNRRVLRWLKTVVVSDAEKAHWMRQVGVGKTVRRPLLLVWGFAGEVSLCDEVTSKPGYIETVSG